MRVPIHSVLFKRITDINWRTLTGRERGQYDLRLGSDAQFETFFDNVPSEEQTDLGGWLRRVPIEAYDGDNPVGLSEIPVRYMGPQSSRRDFYFKSQKYDRPEAYELWKPTRNYTLATPFEDVEGAATIVVRDLHNNFHARWLTRDAIARLPQQLRVRIEREETGVVWMANGFAGISEQSQEVLDALLEHHNVLLYGPPGTGKTFILQEVLRAFDNMTFDTTQEHDPITAGSATHSLWSTFHQSYSYEDFVVGLRPNPRDDGGFSLEAVPGALLEVSEWARQPGQRGLLVIDEINRGNVSRIFGELITLLEVDKRLGEDGASTPTTVSVRLPYISPDHPPSVALPDGTNAVVPFPFTLPRDVYVLATMNSVDTSVAPLDAALRRRFKMHHITPDIDSMSRVLGLGDAVPALDRALTDRNAVCTLALRLLSHVNDGISMFLGADFQLGQWYLAPMIDTTTTDEAKNELANIWRTAIFPQLLEYFSGRSEQLLAVLGNPGRHNALVVHNPEPDWEALGATAFIAPGTNATDDDIIALLISIVSREDQQQ